MIAEASLDLIIKARLVGNIEIYEFRFVIVFEPSGLSLPEFNESVVKTLGKVGHLAFRPREDENSRVVLLASIDNIIDDLIDRTALEQYLQRAIGKN